MRIILITCATLLLVACSVEPGSEQWCALKEAQPKTQWSSSDAVTYARNCLIDGTAVGSESWCNELSSKPFGEWTANDAASYTRYCVI